MTTISLTIPGQPIAKGRPRVTTRGGKPRAITPERTRIYERTVAIVAAQHGQWRMNGPVRVSIEAVFERPKRLKGEYRIVHDKRPDLDNVVKAVLDGLAAHLDDANVYALNASKVYAAKGERPHVSVHLSGAVNVVVDL